MNWDEVEQSFKTPEDGGAKPLSKWDEVEQSFRREERHKAGLELIRQRAQDVQPPEAAKIIQLNRATGLPHDTIGRNLSDVERQAETTKRQKLLDDYPSMRWLYANDPETASVLQNDVERIGQITQKPPFTKKPTAADFPMEQTGGFTQSSQQLRTAQEQYDSGLTDYAYQILSRRPQGGTQTFGQDLETGLKSGLNMMATTGEFMGYEWDRAMASFGLLFMPPDATGRKPTVDDLVGRTESELVSQVHRLEEARDPRMGRFMQDWQEVNKDGDVGGAFATFGQALNAQPDPWGLVTSFAAEQLATSIPAFKVGAMGGAVVAPVISRAATKYISNEVKQKMVEKGIEVAMAGAAGNSFAVYIQSLGSNYAEATQKGLTGEEAVDYANKKTLAEIPTNAIAGAMLAVKIGGPYTNIFAQANIQGAAGATGAGLASLAVGETPDAREMVLEYLGEFLTTPTDMALMPFELRMEARAAASAKLAQDALRARSATDFHQNIQSAVEEINQTEAAGLGMEGKNAIAKALQSAGADETVTIDAQTFSQILEQSGIPLQEVMQTMPAVAEQYVMAAARGGDLVIPTGEFVAHLSQTPAIGPMLENVRQDPEAMTLVESNLHAQEQVDRFLAEAEKIAATKAEDVAWQESKRAVERALQEQMNTSDINSRDVNQKHAKILSAFYETLSAQYPQKFANPEAAMKAYPLEFQNGRFVAPGEGAFEQADITTPEFAQFYGNSMLKTPEGGPLMLFHGTRDNVESFDLNHPNRKDSGWLGTGVSLTDDHHQAEVYAAQKRGPLMPNIMPLYARLENPYMATLADKKRIKSGGRKAADAFTAQLKAAGHDGVILDFGNGTREITIFDPAAVKSVFNKRPTASTNILNQSNSPYAAVWRALAANDEMFKYPMPASFDMGESAQEIDPNLKAEEDTVDEDDKARLAKKWYVTMPDGTHAYVMENNEGQVWIDASRLEEGVSGGSMLYFLVGAYAEGNGKVFIGDPAGMSDVAILRRTENMLSLALRFGKTTFMEPHEFQMNPDAKHDTVLAGIIRPITWVTGDDVNNLDELIKTSHDNTVNLVEEIADVTFNFKQNRFEKDGQPWNDFDGAVQRSIDSIRQRGMSRILSTDNGGTDGQADQRPPIGSATLKRTAVTNTISREAGGEGGRSLLDEVVEFVSGGLGDLRGTLYQPSRASINFQRGIGIDPSIINIGEGSDLSSFIHESGHFFLEVYADLASRPDAPEAIKKQMDTLLKWFGVPDIQTWHSMTLDEKRAHHEKFARAFEQYAFEGKAPRLDMIETFRTFRSWLTRVYKSIKEFIVQFEGGKEKLNDDIRQVMDRMLATEQQIEAAQAARNYAPLFETQEAAGMTDAEWAEYQNNDEAARMAAIDELERRGMKDLQWVRNARLREMVKAKKENEAKIREVRMEVAKEVMVQPIYQVWQFLKHPADKVRKAETSKDFGESARLAFLKTIKDMGGIKVEESKDITGEQANVANKQYPGMFNGDGNALDLIARKLHEDGYITTEEYEDVDGGVQRVRDLVRQALDGEAVMTIEEQGQYYDYDEQPEDEAAWIKEMEDTYGEIPKGEPVPSGKLSIPVIELMYTDKEASDIKARLGTGRYGMLMSEGMDPDEVASLFGFTSGDAMVQMLMETLPPKEVINRLTDQRVLERYGDISSQKALDEAADMAVHNEARMKMVATELAVLSKRLGKYRELAAAAKEAAYMIVNRKKVRDIKPNEFRASETRAAKNAEKALKSGGMEMAAQAKRAQILNGYATRMAYEALQEVDKALKYLAKFEKDSTRKSIDSDYIDQIDDLLQPFDLRKGVSLKAIDKRKSLAEWIDSMIEQGYEPAVDEKLIAEAKTKHYKDMTMHELREMVETVKHIEHLGRLKQKLLTAQDQREFAAITAEIKQSIEDNANRTVKARATPSDAVGRLGKLGRDFAAWHRKIASIAREMDGNQDGGPVWQYLIRPMNEAGDNEVEMKMQAGEALAKLFEPIQSAIKKEIVGNNLYARKRVVPGTNLSMTREQRIMAVLNMGNEGNIQRLTDGGMEGHGQFTKTELKAILDSLTKEEMDFVQGIWDYLETSRPAVAELQKRLTGREPEWIEPTPLVTKYGTYRGGYFPAKYDVDLSTRSDSLEALTDIKAAQKGAMGSASARNTSVKERAAEVKNRPILLSFSVISRHANETAHWLAWQGWLLDANRLLKALDSPIREHYGPEILKAMRNTVEDIAKGDVGASNPWERIANHLRMGSTIVGLGWRLTTGLIQFTGLSQSVERIGAGYVARGSKEFAANPIETIKAVQEESTFMRHRMDTQYREANEVLATIRAGEKMSTFKASFFTFITRMQFLVDMPTYLGAKEKAYADLKLENALDQAERDAIEKEAIARAEQAVLDSQGGGMLKDLAGAQRGTPYHKLWTNFYSYFNTTYQRNVEAFRRTHFKNIDEVGRFAVDMALINAVPVLIQVIMYEMLKNKCDWDSECMAKEIAQQQVSYMAGQMVGVRDLVAAAITPYGSTGPAGLAIYNDVKNLGTQIGQGEADLAFWKATNKVGGTLLHYPAGQINTTLDGIYAIEQGKAEGAGIPAALIAGAPKK